MQTPQKILDHTYEFIDGIRPVVLTAPHVFNHRRPSINGVLKQGEPWTDTIVKAVCENSGAYGVVQSESTEYDGNFHKIEQNPFKQELKRLSENMKLELIVDIHGLSDKHQYDIGIYYESRFHKSRKVAFEVAKSLNHGKLKGVLTQVFNLAANNQETIAEYGVEQLSVPSIQIEIARYIREDELLREALIKLLSAYVKTY